MVHKSLTIVALLLALVLASCKPGQVTNSLQLVIVAAETAVSTLGATGSLSASQVSDLNGYLGAVSKATSFAATELASTDSGALKASKIAGQFAAIAAPNLRGTPATIVTVIQAVTTAVANFLSTIQPPPGVRANAKTPQKEIQVSAADQRELVKIKARADTLAAKTGK